MTKPVILDLETQKIFQEVAGKVDKLGISVVGLYNYADDSYKAYFEKDLPGLFPILETASLIIGFNIVRFDLEVLKPYYVGDITKFNTLDLLEEIKKVLGKRIALEELVKETLKAKKEGHGLMAVNYYKEGKLDLLKKYCLSDVRLTKELYEYGKNYGKVFYQGPYGRVEIKTDWGRKLQKNELNLTLPI